MEQLDHSSLQLIIPVVITLAAGLMLIFTGSRYSFIKKQLLSLQEIHRKILDTPMSNDPTSNHVRSLRLDQVKEALRHSNRSVRLIGFTQLLLSICLIFMVLCAACLGLSEMARGLVLGFVSLLWLGGISLAIGVLVNCYEILLANAGPKIVS